MTLSNAIDWTGFRYTSGETSEPNEVSSSLNDNVLPWLVGVSGLSAGLQTKNIPSLIPFQGTCQGVDQVPSWGHARGSLSMFFSHINVSFLFLPPFPCL